MIPELIILALAFGFSHSTAFGTFRAFVEVALIEDLWKNVLKTYQTIANKIRGFVGLVLKPRVKPWDFDWEFYQYIHAAFYFCIALISFMMFIPPINAVILSFAFLWWYGVVLDGGYFLIRMWLVDTTWNEEAEYMKEWVDKAPIPGFLTLFGKDIPLWYITNVIICVVFILIGIIV